MLGRGTAAWMVGLAAFLVLIGSAPTQAEPTVEARLRSAVASFRRACRIASAERRRARGESLLREYVDLRAFAARSLQDVPATMDPEHRAALARALAAVIERRALDQLRTENARACMDARISNHRVVKALRVLSFRCGESEREVELWFANEDSAWRVVDVAFDRALLSRQYRGLINKQLRTKGYAALLSALEAKGRDDGAKEAP